MANKALISDSLLDNMERKLNDLQSKQREHDAARDSYPTSTPGTGRGAANFSSGGGVDSTRKYNDLQKQMDQMLGMVRNESDNVRQIENSLYTGGSAAGTPGVRFDQSQGQVPQAQPIFHTQPRGSPPVNHSFNPQQEQSGSIATFGNTRDFENKLSSILNRSRNQPQTAENAEVKSELEGVIAGLSEYLNHMKHDLERLKKENERLKILLAENKNRVQQVEGENKDLLGLKGDYDRLEEKLREIHIKLESSEYNNDELKKELSKYPDLPTIEMLKQAERDANAMREAMKSFREEVQTEREALNQQIRTEIRRADELQKRIIELERKEKELNQTQVQLASVTATRDSLKEQLIDVQNTFKRHVETSIKPEDLLRHIQEMTANVDRMSGEVRPYHDHDVSGKALSDLQKIINSKFQEQKHEFDILKKAYDVSQQDVKELEDELRNEQEKHRKSREQAVAQRNQDKAAFEEKVRQWQDEIKKTRDRGENQRDQFETELNRAEAERRDLDKQFREAEKDLLRQEVSNSEKYDRMQRELAELKDIIKSTTDSNLAQVRNYEKTIADYDDKVMNLERKVSELEKTCSLLDRDLARSNLEFEQASKQISDMNLKLQEEQRNCEKHQDIIEQLRAEESRMKTLSRSQKEDIAKLSNLFEKALEGGVHNEEVTRLTSEIGNLQNYVNGQDDTIRKLSEELRRAEVSAQQPRFVKDSETADVVRSEDPNSGIYCNVMAHHRQEDYINALKAKLLKASRSRKVESSLKKYSRELDRVQVALEQAKSDLGQVEEKSQASVKKYKMINEKVEVFQQSLREVTNRSDVIDYFHGKGNFGLPTEIADALKKHSAVAEDLAFLENLLEQKREESNGAEKRLIDFESQLGGIQNKTKGVLKQYSEAKKHLGNTQIQAKKLVEQVHATSAELGHASSTLASLKKETEDYEKKKKDLEDDLKDVNQIIARKNLEFQNLQHKQQKMKENADDIRHTEDELFGHLKASEKALNDRKQELQSLQSQAAAEAREVQDIEAELIRRRTELQMVKDELTGKQTELAAVLKDGEDDLNKKTRDIRDSKSDLETIQASINEFEKLRAEKKRELDELREKVLVEENGYQNAKNSLMTSTQELKSLRELIIAEKSDLEKLRAQRGDLSSTNYDF